MRVVIQRVKSASCIIDNKTYSSINNGYVLLVGFTHTDTIDNVKSMVKKIVNLRIFEDENGKMNLNINQASGEILSISQFTLYANTTGGNRPSFVESLNPSEARDLYNEFNYLLAKEVKKVATGIFGATMLIDLVNDGPVTINLEF